MEPPTRATWRTVYEMRQNKELIEKKSRWEKGGGTRFERSTDPAIALQYFSANDAILECGPAFGSFSKFLQDKGFRNIHALDFVDILHYPDRSRLTFHEIDFNMETMPYSDGFFDGICAWGIGEHLENPFHFIRECRRVLKPEKGICIFSVPNVFHVVSRLLFLKKGMFPSWNETNNHISVLPHGVFEKTVLRYFDLIETKYTKPRLTLWGLDRFSKLLPANEWFGDYVVYVLRARKDPRY